MKCRTLFQHPRCFFYLIPVCFLINNNILLHCRNSNRLFNPAIFLCLSQCIAIGDPAIKREWLYHISRFNPISCVCLSQCIDIGDPAIKREWLDHISRFNPIRCLCLSQSITIGDPAIKREWLDHISRFNPAIFL